MAPSPKNDRADISIRLVPISRLAVTTIGPIIFGSISVNTICIVSLPLIFAAFIYVEVFVDSTRPLESLAYLGHPTEASAIIAPNTPFLKSPAVAIASTSPGNAKNISDTRISKVSAIPPRYPQKIPITTPITAIKSTTAKAVAKALGYVYIDTGAMYRAVTYLALEKGYASTSGIEVKPLMKALRQSEIKFVYNPEVGFAELYLNGKNIENDIRSIDVANWVSEIAKQPEIRTYLVNLQRKMGEAKGVVMDGRDIGTVVFPNAELKIFMTASEQVRAERRYNELKSKGDNTSFAEVLANIQHRDHIDTTRKESPLKKADDAIVIDNTHLTIDQQVEKILSLVNNK